MTSDLAPIDHVVSMGVETGYDGYGELPCPFEETPDIWDDFCPV